MFAHYLSACAIHMAQHKKWSRTLTFVNLFMELTWFHYLCFTGCLIVGYQMFTDIIMCVALHCIGSYLRAVRFSGIFGGAHVVFVYVVDPCHCIILSCCQKWRKLWFRFDSPVRFNAAHGHRITMFSGLAPLVFQNPWTVILRASWPLKDSIVSPPQCGKENAFCCRPSNNWR